LKKNEDINEEKMAISGGGEVEKERSLKTASA